MARTSPAKFVRQVRGEITRITWATRKDTLTSTITVLIMVVIASLFFSNHSFKLNGSGTFVVTSCFTGGSATILSPVGTPVSHSFELLYPSPLHYRP